MAESDADTMPPNRIGVVVLGMHRSGTSAFSRLFSLLGCDLPLTLIGADEFNETGYWASEPVRALNDRIFESAGTSWKDWLAVSPGWSTSLKVPAFRRATRQVLRDEFGDAALFVLNDPRICRLAPFWFENLDAEGISPRVLVALRHPLDVVASLYRRHAIEPGVGHLLWLRHLLDAEHGSRGQLRLFASYEQLLGDWPQIIERSATAFNLSWPRHSNWTDAEIVSFLGYGNRRQIAAPRGMSSLIGIPNWVRDSYAILSRWADTGESAADFAALDAIRMELDTAAPAFVNLIAAGETAARNVKSKSDELAAAQQALEVQKSAAAANLAAKVTAHEATLQQVSLRFHQQLADREAAATKVPVARDQNYAAAAALAAKQLADLEAEIIATRHQFAQTDSALKQRQLEAEEATAEAAQLRNDIAALTARFEAQSRASADLEAASALVQANAQRLTETLTKTETNSRKLETRLAGRFDELAALSRLLLGSETALRTALAATIDAKRWPGVPRSLRVRLQKRALNRSGLFDAAWYASFYPDVGTAGVDPALHYIQHGAAEGREPNPSLAHVDPIGGSKNG